MDTPTCLRILLIADAQPDVLLRVAAQLNVLNAAPRGFSLVLGADETVRVEIEPAAADRHAIDLLVRKLGQLTCTREVSLDASP